LLTTGVQVQALIEHCLQAYMNQKEVIDAVSQQAKIDPGITELGNALCYLLQ